MRIGSQKPLKHERILSSLASAVPDLSLIQKSKHVQGVSFNPSTFHPKIIGMQKSDSDEDRVMALESQEE